ncbi:unique cartilage matrix-associated protein isoform X3 [Cebus imitator]|uniref:unique cartilage matrix-associated protein isoform X3 n=1 Tax=Cebus imitator TaxID=2715852 RepID=UPI001899B8B3|nr:unique cartilage matrix-associated protein isoform X3 [Cebus imitator]
MPRISSRGVASGPPSPKMRSMTKENQKRWVCSKACVGESAVTSENYTELGSNSTSARVEGTSISSDQETAESQRASSTPRPSTPPSSPTSPSNATHPSWPQQRRRLRATYEVTKNLIKGKSDLSTFTST